MHTNTYYSLVKLFVKLPIARNGRKTYKKRNAILISLIKCPQDPYRVSFMKFLMMDSKLQIRRFKKIQKAQKIELYLLVVLPVISMMHLQSRAISRELNGRTRTATFTDDMAAVAAPRSSNRL